MGWLKDPSEWRPTTVGQERQNNLAVLSSQGRGHGIKRPREGLQHARVASTLGKFRLGSLLSSSTCVAAFRIRRALAAVKLIVSEFPKNDVTPLDDDTGRPGSLYQS